MKTAIIPLPQPFRLQIVVEDIDQVNRLCEEVWLQKKDNLQFRGFRKGEVTRSIAEKKLGVQTLYKEVLDQILSKGVAESKAEICEISELIVDWHTENKPLCLYAICIPFPKVEQVNYQFDNVAYERLVVSELDIQNNLRRLAISEAIDIEQSEVSENSSVLVNFTMYDEEKNLIGSQQEILCIPSAPEVYGFEKQLIGKTVPSQFSTEIVVPASFFNEAYRNKTCKFTINVVKCTIAEVPPIDDALAQKIGFESLEVLKQSLAKDLAQDKAKLDDLFFRDAVMAHVVERARFTPIADSLIKKELQTLLDAELKAQSQRQKKVLSEEEYFKALNSTREQWEAMNWIRGVRKIKANLVLEYVFEQERLILSPEEKMKELEILVPLEENREKIDKALFESYLRRKKAQDFLVESAARTRGAK